MADDCKSCGLCVVRSCAHHDGALGKDAERGARGARFVTGRERRRLVRFGGA